MNRRELVLRGLRFLKSRRGLAALSRVGPRNMVSALVSGQIFLRHGGASLSLNRSEFFLLTALEDEIEQLEREGFRVELTNSSLRVEGYPYLREPMAGALGKLGFAGALNALSLLGYCYRYGGAVGATDSGDGAMKRTFQFNLGEALVTTPSKVRFDLNSIEPSALIETYLLGIHSDLKPSGRSVLDVGALARDTALYFASMGASSVYSIEPLEENYDAMPRNLNLNPGLREAIVPVRAALGPAGKLLLRYPPSAGGLTGSASAFAQRRRGSESESESESEEGKRESDGWLSQEVESYPL